MTLCPDCPYAMISFHPGHWICTKCGASLTEVGDRKVKPEEPVRLANIGEAVERSSAPGGTT